MAESAKRVAKKFRLEGGVQPDKPPHERPIEDMQNLRSPLGGGSGLHPREGICPVITLTTSKATGAAIHLVEVPGKSQSKLLTITSAAGGEIREIVETPSSFGRYLDPGEQTSTSDSDIVEGSDFAVPVMVSQGKIGVNPILAYGVICMLWYPVTNKWNLHYLTTYEDEIDLAELSYFPPVMLSSDLMLVMARVANQKQFFVYSITQMKSDGAAFSDGATTYGGAIKTAPLYTIRVQNTSIPATLRYNEPFAVCNPNQDGVWCIPVDFDTASSSCLRWIELSVDGATLKTSKVPVGDKWTTRYGSYRLIAKTVAAADSGNFSTVASVADNGGGGNPYGKITIVPVNLSSDTDDSTGKTSTNTYGVGLCVIDPFYDNDVAGACGSYYKLPSLISAATGDINVATTTTGYVVVQRGGKFLCLTNLIRQFYASKAQTWVFSGETMPHPYSCNPSTWSYIASGYSSYTIPSTSSYQKSVSLAATYTNVTMLYSLGGYGDKTWFTHDTSSDGVFKLAYITWSAASPSASNCCTITSSGTLGDWFRLDAQYAMCLVKKPTTGYGDDEYAFVKVDLIGASVSILTVEEEYSAESYEPACPKVSGGVGWVPAFASPRIAFNPARFIEDFGQYGSGT